jgi:hypothetical protein
MRKTNPPIAKLSANPFVIEDDREKIARFYGQEFSRWLVFPVAWSVQI